MRLCGPCLAKLPLLSLKFMGPKLIFDPSDTSKTHIFLTCVLKMEMSLKNPQLRCCLIPSRAPSKREQSGTGINNFALAANIIRNTPLTTSIWTLEMDHSCFSFTPTSLFCLISESVLGNRTFKTMCKSATVFWRVSCEKWIQHIWGISTGQKTIWWWVTAPLTMMLPSEASSCHAQMSHANVNYLLNNTLFKCAR